jgi:hypothetical protein
MAENNKRLLVFWIRSAPGQAMTPTISSRRRRELAALSAMAQGRGFSIGWHRDGLTVGLCAGPWCAENIKAAGRYTYIKNVLEMFPPRDFLLTEFSLP